VFDFGLFPNRDGNFSNLSLDLEKFSYLEGKLQNIVSKNAHRNYL
jgi:hypothetical protein